MGLTSERGTEVFLCSQNLWRCYSVIIIDWGAWMLTTILSWLWLAALFVISICLRKDYLSKHIDLTVWLMPSVTWSKCSARTLNGFIVRLVTSSHNAVTRPHFIKSDVKLHWRTNNSLFKWLRDRIYKNVSLCMQLQHSHQIVHIIIFSSYTMKFELRIQYPGLLVGSQHIWQRLGVQRSILLLLWQPQKCGTLHPSN